MEVMLSVTTELNIGKHTLEAVEKWAAYYRWNPHRFAKDILRLDLKLFQKLLLVAMNWAFSFIFIASRG